MWAYCEIPRDIECRIRKEGGGETIVLVPNVALKVATMSQLLGEGGRQPPAVYSACQPQHLH